MDIDYDSDATVDGTTGDNQNSPILYDICSQATDEQHLSQFSQLESLASLLPTVPIHAISQRKELQKEQKQVTPLPKQNKKRKKCSAAPTQKACQAKQAGIVALLQKILPQETLTVWSLLQVFDFVELSTLASYQGEVISTHTTKKELAETVTEYLKCGKFAAELTAVASLPDTSHPMSSSMTAPSQKTALMLNESQLKCASAQTTQAVGVNHLLHQQQPHSPRSSLNISVSTLTSKGPWKTASENDIRLLNLSCGGAVQGGQDETARSSALVEVDGGVKLPSTGWRRAIDSDMSLLEFDSPCFSSLKSARRMRPAGTWVSSRQVGATATGSESRESVIGELKQSLAALVPQHLMAQIKLDGHSFDCPEDTTGLRPCLLHQKGALVERENASTQTMTQSTSSQPQLAPSLPYTGHNTSRTTATKVVRFDSQSLGLILKQLRTPNGYITALMGVRSDGVDPAVRNLLTSGDELLLANGQSVVGLSFAEQMDLLRGAGRPLFLTFATPNK